MAITVDRNSTGESGGDVSDKDPMPTSPSTSNSNRPMSKYTVTTKSYKEIAAEFAAGFKSVTPQDAKKPVSQADWLEPYRPHVMKQRNRGVTWKQIADTMARPPINVPVTERILIRIFASKVESPTPLSGDNGSSRTPPTNSTSSPTGASPNSTAAAAPASPNSTANSTPKPTSRRYILDPYTNLPITPP